MRPEENQVVPVKYVHRKHPGVSNVLTKCFFFFAAKYKCAPAAQVLNLYVVFFVVVVVVV